VAVEAEEVGQVAAADGPEVAVAASEDLEAEVLVEGERAEDGNSKELRVLGYESSAKI
jgi:hypothetical protein